MRALRLTLAGMALLGLLAACGGSGGGGSSDTSTTDTSQADIGVDTTTTVSCTSDAECQTAFTDKGQCQVAVCDTTLAEPVCILGNADDGTTCDDGDDCTEEDACQAGACVGTPVVGCGPCSSNDDCAEFEDGNPCNGTLICDGGLCVVDSATVVTCPADNDTGCEKNTCVPETGECAMQAVPEATPCIGEDPDCLAGFVCRAGTCVCAGASACDPPCGDCQICVEGTCEECPGEWVCQAGVCREVDPCNGIPFEGCCDEGQLTWCENSELQRIDCTSNEPPLDTCGWSEAAAGYDCGGADTAPSEFPETCDYYFCEPSQTCGQLGLSCGAHPECPALSCGDCAPGQTCNGGSCEDCNISGSCTALQVECGPHPDCATINCGDCAAGYMCVAGTCVELPQCTPAGTISCDQTITGDTNSGTDTFTQYSCQAWAETGPELVYEFTPDTSGAIRVRFTETPGADLDLWLLDSLCAEDQCVAYGDNDFEFEVTAGTTYFLAVDGYDGVAATFSLELDCAATCDDPACGTAECGESPNCWGYSCGTCTGDDVCVDGICKPNVCAATGVPEARCCAGDTLRECLGDGSTGELDCTQDGNVCGWFEGDDTYDPGYYCAPTDLVVSEDPSGTYPRECPDCDNGQLCADLGFECGPGCPGETCGTCTEGEFCDDHQLCATCSCEGRECGVDECGNSCGTCTGENEACVDFQCVEVPTCAATETIECGATPATVSGNNGTDGTAVVPAYSGCTTLQEEGAEVAYSFTPSCTGDVTVTLAGLSADLDLFVVEGTCAGETCIGSSTGVSDETITFEGVADTTYFIVVDGYGADTTSDYTLTVNCACSCEPDCFGLECGPDPVCGTSCGECGDTSVCAPEGYCASCESFCAGRECGPNPECPDQSCGSDCPTGEWCTSLGVCELDQCALVGQPDESCCDGDSLQVCGNDHTVALIDCTENGNVCGWYAGDASYPAGYYCGPADMLDNEDPAGTYPRACPTCDNTAFCADQGFECGPGCPGEECGTCGDGAYCTDAQTCATCSCDGRDCGDDGCGTSCGVCTGAGEACNQAGQCVVVPTCSPGAELSCAAVPETISASTTAGSSTISSYPGCTDWDESGPELAYPFTPSCDGPVTAVFAEAPAADLDILVLRDYCAGLSCVAAGDASVTFDALEGESYFIVVDGYGGESGDFTLKLVCECACEPQCGDRVCGVDPACGTSCGTCEGDDVCTVDGQCVTDRCAGLSDLGCCTGSYEVFCDLDYYALAWNECVDSACGWNDLFGLFQWYGCGGSGSDPSGTYPLACASCDNATYCTGFECGPGCPGESCGSCSAGQRCNDRAHKCEPCSCDGRECGDDGCGTSCGTCDGGFECVDFQCVEGARKK